MLLTKCQPISANETPEIMSQLSARIFFKNSTHWRHDLRTNCRAAYWLFQSLLRTFPKFMFFESTGTENNG